MKDRFNEIYKVILEQINMNVWRNTMSILQRFGTLEKQPKFGDYDSYVWKLYFTNCAVPAACVFASFLVVTNGTGNVEFRQPLLNDGGKYKELGSKWAQYTVSELIDFLDTTVRDSIKTLDANKVMLNRPPEHVLDSLIAQLKLI